MRFDSQEQKDFVINAVNHSPVQTTIGALLRDAGAVVPMLQAIKAGGVGPEPDATGALDLAVVDAVDAAAPPPPPTTPSGAPRRAAVKSPKP